MVAEKSPDKNHNFANDPIIPVRDGENVRADKTTLGADNGIGLTATMAIATDPEAVHPPLELLITVDEERGFIGTFNLNLEELGVISQRLINLDNEQLGETGIQSAGLRMATGIRRIERESTRPDKKGSYCRLVVTDLPGGHSAKNIADGTPNAIKVMAELLSPKKSFMRLVSIRGGERINGIPITCEVVVFVPDDKELDFIMVKTKEEALEAAIKSHGGKLSVTNIPPEEVTCANMTAETHSAVLAALEGIKSGTDCMHPDHPNAPFTSRNLGTVDATGQEIKIGYSMRSPDGQEIERVSAEIAGILEKNGFTATTNFQIPTWNASTASQLVTIVNRAYQDISGKPAKLGVTHGGLEPSVIVQKLSQHLGGVPIESAAFGPDIRNPHSPSEYVNIKSVKVFYEQLKRSTVNFFGGINV